MLTFFGNPIALIYTPECVNNVILRSNYVMFKSINEPTFEWEISYFKYESKMKTNEVLQREVQDAIKWEPLLSAAEIGVTAVDGVITLTGIVNSFAKKSEAEDAAKNVSGVKAVIEKIEIKIGSSVKKDDEEIAKEVLNVFKWNWEFPGDKLRIKVEDGWVTLTGDVHWFHQKETAKKSISNLIGIKGISNNIQIVAETHDEIEQKDIESALSRNWTIDDLKVQVIVQGNKVKLSGSVRSLYQKDQAAHIAWSAPGVLQVENDIVVDPPQ